MLGTKEQRTEGMKRQAQDLIDQAYQHGYQKAEEDYHIQSEKDRDSSYQCGYEYGVEQGRNQAWEAAKRVSCGTLVGGYSYNDLIKIFGTPVYDNIFTKNTASEAIEKLKAWEQKQQDNKNPGWKEYSDIKSKCEELLAKGYTKAMLKTVIEQMKEGDGE